MTLKTFNVADINLFSGSTESIRQALGGLFVNETGGFRDQEVSVNQNITLIESNYAETNASVDDFSLINSVKFASRLYGPNNDNFIRSDEEWKSYIVGGTFGDTTYPGVYDSNVYFDHRVNIGLPLYQDELNNSSDTISGYSRAEYYKYYGRYQQSLNLIESEHLIPNYYFLSSPYDNGADIEQFVNLEGNAEDIDAIFSFVDDDTLVPRYQYLQARNYLNTEYVNHAFSDELKAALQNKLQNIIFTNERFRDLFVPNRAPLRIDYEPFNESIQNKLFSLMPMSNHIYFETDFDSDRSSLVTTIIENDYRPLFLKTLKEIFSDEISLKPTQLDFVIDNTNSQTTATLPLNVVDLPQMLVYNLRNSLSQTDNCIFFNDDSEIAKAALDADGAYRFVNSEIVTNTLNDVVRFINNRFSTSQPQSLEEFLNSSLGDEKYHETLAYRIQKIGGPPTGDSRTENTLQNFWFFNAASAINYIDTQVKYDTSYTYKIFSYVAIQGFKYKLSDLSVTRQIATEGDINCLEFYDPATGATSANIFSSDQTIGIETINEANRRAKQEWQQEVDALVASIPTAPASDVPDLVEQLRALNEEDPRALLVASSFEGDINQFATNAQAKSTFRYLSDLNLSVEPSLKIVEVPIQQKTFKILDNPPNDLIATPIQPKDQSHRLMFFLSYDTFTPNSVPYPTSLTSLDEDNRRNYLQGNDLLSQDLIQEESVSRPVSFEVYRVSEKPSSYQNFENNIRQTIDLLTLDQGRAKLDALFSEKVKPNQKYYYTFRAINENGIAGEFTPIFETELINDGGYIYANFNQLTEEELITDEISEPLMSFKKLFNVVPNFQHLILNSNDVDFSDSAFNQVDNFSLGAADDKIWGKTFKIRLTSNKTGKKIDLNIKFNNIKG
jgi:hypothetical protein